MAPSDLPSLRIGYNVFETTGATRWDSWRTERATVLDTTTLQPRIVGASLIPSGGDCAFVAWDGESQIVRTDVDTDPNREESTQSMSPWRQDVYVLRKGHPVNLTAIDRVSSENTYVHPVPGQSLYSFQAMDVKGNSQPWVMDKDGTHKRHLVSDGGFTYGVNVAACGLMSYHDDYRAYICRLDGTQQRQILTNQVFSFMPVISPDGKKVMLLAGPDHLHPSLYIADMETLQSRKVCDRGGYDGCIRFLSHDWHDGSSDLPTWSPDSRRIYMTRKEGNGLNLFAYDLASTRLIQVSRFYNAEVSHPSVSADGLWIVVSVKFPDQGRNLWLLSHDGCCAKQITRLPDGWAAMWPQVDPF